jgi:hypothetical protein
MGWRNAPPSADGRQAALVVILFCLPIEAEESNLTVEKLRRLCEGYFKFANDSDAADPRSYYVLGITDGFLQAGDLGRSIHTPAWFGCRD